MKNIGIIGSGTMGSGIAQVAATAGCKVKVFDTQKQALVYSDKKLRSVLERLVEKERISEYFSYFAPYSRKNIADQSVDIAMSLSTMEHVKSPEELYRMLYCWLAPNALLINKIGFSSHGMTRRWYGHYLLPTSVWRIIQGKKVNYLNRWTEKSHLDFCKNLGFELVKRVPYETFESAPAKLNDLPFAALHIWKKPICDQ